MGGRLLDQLTSLYSFRMVGDVRGKGLLLGIEFVADRETRLPFTPEEGVAWKVRRAALEEGLWIYGGSGSNNGTSGDHILIAPPYIISETQIDELVQKLTNAIRAVQADYD
jgi:adenosylmethionine-8-amino-7-oxononanoate aminotransferase